jgi:hydroxymethylbilane synthase
MIVIGSRGSALALAQTGWVQKQILSRFPGTDVTIKVIKTSADKDLHTSIRSGSSVGVFVKELEQALSEKEIDIAVHSMKDLPTTIPTELKIAAIPEREDARDAFISFRASTVMDLPSGSTVGTGSVRRQSQLLALRTDLRIMDVRGNVDTRLKKLKDGEYDAIILACAGLNRLGLQKHITAPLEYAQMLPAPGQGALAIEIRKNDAAAEKIVSALNHHSTEKAVTIERIFLKTMGGGCNVPVAVNARYNHDAIEIVGLIASPDGAEIIRESAKIKPEEAAEAAVSLANKILARGGRAILDQL